VKKFRYTPFKHTNMANKHVLIEDGDDWVRIYEGDELVHDDHPYGRSLDIAAQYKRSGYDVDLFFGNFGGEYGDEVDDDGKLKFVPSYKEELE